jgi:hypothetical protein
MSRLEKLKTEKWFQVLDEQINKTNITEVARQIGYSRTSVSLVYSGTYDGGTTAIALKVMKTFTDLVNCPFLDEDITNGECSDHQSRAMPTSSPKDLRHWMECRSGCPHSTITHGETYDA